MPLVNALGALSLEETQQQIAAELAALKGQQAAQLDTIATLTDTLVLLVEQLRNSAPLVDGADRLRVSIETGVVGIASNQTLTTLSTLQTLNGLQSNGLAAMGFNTPALQLIGHGVAVTP